LALALFASTGCSASAKGLPESLHGTWKGGNDEVSTLRFSEGGRVELNEGECAGEYRLSAIDGNKGTINSGYINCGSIMDGTFQATVTTSGDSLTVKGSVVGGEYERA